MLGNGRETTRKEEPYQRAIVRRGVKAYRRVFGEVNPELSVFGDESHSIAGMPLLRDMLRDNVTNMSDAQATIFILMASHFFQTGSIRLDDLCAIHHYFAATEKSHNLANEQQSISRRAAYAVYADTADDLDRVPARLQFVVAANGGLMRHRVPTNTVTLLQADDDDDDDTEQQQLQAFAVINDAAAANETAGLLVLSVCARSEEARERLFREKILPLARKRGFCSVTINHRIQVDYTRSHDEYARTLTERLGFEYVGNVSTAAEAAHFTLVLRPIRMAAAALTTVMETRRQATERTQNLLCKEFNEFSALLDAELQKRREDEERAHHSSGPSQKAHRKFRARKREQYAKERERLLSALTKLGEPIDSLETHELIAGHAELTEKLWRIAKLLNVSQNNEMPLMALHSLYSEMFDRLDRHVDRRRTLQKDTESWMRDSTEKDTVAFLKRLLSHHFINANNLLIAGIVRERVEQQRKNDLSA